MTTTQQTYLMSVLWKPDEEKLEQEKASTRFWYIVASVLSFGNALISGLTIFTHKKYIQNYMVGWFAVGGGLVLLLFPELYLATLGKYYGGLATMTHFLMTTLLIGMIVLFVHLAMKNKNKTKMKDQAMMAAFGMSVLYFLMYLSGATSITVKKGKKSQQPPQSNPDRE